MRGPVWHAGPGLACGARSGMGQIRLASNRRPAPAQGLLEGTRVHVMAKHKLVKRAAAVTGIVGTMASIWWFALKPRRKKS